MAELEMKAEDTKKESAARQMRIKERSREVMKSRRTRRRAREIFTELKATGKIPKGMKFEDLSDQKFFEAAKDIKDVELRRRLIQMSRDQQEKSLKKSSEEKRKKMFGR